MYELHVFLTYMSIYNQKLAFGNLLLVHLSECFLSILWLFETNISVVLKVLLIVTLNLSRFDFTKISEESFELLVVSALGKTLDEQVVELGDSSSRFPLFLLSMDSHFDLLALDFSIVELSDGLLGCLFGLKLDVGVPAALTVWVSLKFA